jgi:protein-S-isoprenylcysteine O-methyltransferase Ste14
MKSQTRNYVLNYLTLILVLIFLFFFLRLYLEPGRPLNIFTYAGIFLVIPSAVLFTVARIQLGSSFQVSAEAHRLVKTGLYKKTRHPVYLFGSIFLLGMIFITQTFPLVIIWIVIIVLQLNRIKKEEKVLVEKFGDEYAAYKKQTWF